MVVFMNDSNKDFYYMHQALALAEQAYKNNEVPIGAVVVSSDGQILGTGYNQTERAQCQDHHAELCAIRKACKKQDSWRLEGCTLYVTLEPCVMCIGCIVLSRIERLVYAAESPKFGYHFGRENICELYGKQVKNVTVGVCKLESQKLLKNFFQERRKS